MANHKHVKIFDSLRGIMAAWVAIAHTQMAFDWEPLGAWAKIANVSYAVSVFIMLSGFVIALLIDTQHEKYPVFITRRAFRLFPVYLFALILSAATIDQQIAIWKSLASTGAYWQGRLGTLQDSSTYFWPQLLSHLLLLQGLLGNTVPSSDFAFIEPAWSLSLEWQFYLVAPMLMLAMHDTRRLGLLLLVTLGLAASQGNLGSGFLPNRIHYFLIGIASYYLFTEFRAGRARRLPLLLLCAALLIRNIPGLIWALFFCIAVYDQAAVRWLRKFLELPPFRILGEMSYSVYVLHTLMIYPAYRMCLSLTQDPYLLAWWTVVVTLVLTLGLSRLTFIVLERPGIRYGKAFSGRWS